MRLVVDHHVDRLEMQGCISEDPESTSTNGPEACQKRLLVSGGRLAKSSPFLFNFLSASRSTLSGDCVGGVTPVPIPNTEVKPAGADGTARETVWESRKSPGLF